MPGTVKSELFPDAAREIQMWLAGDGNFLESSLDNGHFITGMHPGGRNNPCGTKEPDRDASGRPKSSLWN